MAEKLKINISFPQYDKHIYDFIKEQKNPSAFVRKLVEAYMNGTLGNMIMQQAINNPNMAFGFNPIQPFQNREQEVAITEENDKKNNDVDTGEFTPEYKIDSKELDKINKLTF